MDYKIISQSEFSKLIGKARQYVSMLAGKRECPFTIIQISGQTKIVMDKKTLTFISRSKK